MNITTSKSSFFIFELQEPFESLEFQFVPPELNWERSGNWVNVPIVGRNNSKKHLTGGEDRLSFTLDFNSLYEDDKALCIQKLTFLQSLTMTDGYSGPARNVKVAWGQSDLFRHKIWIVRRVGGKMSLFHGDYDFNPMQLYVDVELELDPVENLRLADVRLQPSEFAGTPRRRTPNIQ
jgi:hypothetical protein